MRWALISLFALSCHDSASQRTYTDSGALCLRASTHALRAEVKLLGCVSSSCNRQTVNNCVISRQGEQIIISSRLVLERNKANCATDCSSWTIRCEIPAPSSGTYQVAFGAARAALTLPLERDTEIAPDGSTRPCAAEEPQLGVSPQM
ncbi:MAG TPA: hypothetical protein VFS67_05600 [Polyangiaceae bacterium]|nr:hypothetical protein [Polyangiaceae bacterium]